MCVEVGNGVNNRDITSRKRQLIWLRAVSHAVCGHTLDMQCLPGFMHWSPHLFGQHFFFPKQSPSFTQSIVQPGPSGGFGHFPGLVGGTVHNKILVKIIHHLPKCNLFIYFIFDKRIPLR